MRKLMTIGAAAVIAVSGSAVGLTLLAASSPAGAAKGPVAVTCSAIAGSTTIAVEVNPAAPSASVRGAMSDGRGETWPRCWRTACRAVAAGSG